jgi:hypothetical protein
MTKPLETGELISLTEQDYGIFEHCGEEARLWLAELRKEGTLEILNRIAAALAALRRFEVRTGAGLLDSAEADIRARRAGKTRFPSIDHLLERYRVSTRAYLSYLEGDLGRARAELSRAHDEVRTILGLDGFLLPLAIQCADFVIQSARVARREKRWREAQQHVRTIHEIFSGLSPLCVLDSGKAVGLPDIRAFFAALPLNEEQREQAHRFMGDHIPVARRVEYLEEVIFTLPDLVIPYP